MPRLLYKENPCLLLVKQQLNFKRMQGSCSNKAANVRNVCEKPQDICDSPSHNCFSLQCLGSVQQVHGRSNSNCRPRSRSILSLLSPIKFCRCFAWTHCRKQRKFVDCGGQTKVEDQQNVVGSNNYVLRNTSRHRL